MSFFDLLPDELLHHILHYLSPEETLETVAFLSRRFNSIAQEPLLWKYYCRSSFRYWQAEHRFDDKVHAELHHVHWKRLYLLRLARNRHIAGLVDGIVASHIARLEKTEKICRYGYDAKDYLLSQCRIDESADDVLARRYYSCTVLDSIHRSLAIEEWAKYQDHAARRIDENTPNGEKLNCGMRLERALGAFDMFMLHDNEGDLDEISQLLDDMASRFRTAYSDVDQMTTRQKATTLARWLHANNMTGLNDPSEETYRYLRNCLIGRALRDDRHPSLPIISAAIYSSIASRVGIEAYPSALPNHVHAIVLAPPGISLDGSVRSQEDAQQQETMFLDPYGSDEEVPIDYIQNFLFRLGVHTGHDNLMRPTATDLIVMRTAQNIRASFTSFRTGGRPLSQLIPMIELNRGDWARNLQPALYSMIWASIMMVPVLPENEDVRWDWQQDVRDLLVYFYEYFPEDSWLIEKYVCPMYDAFAAPSRRQNNWELPSKRVRDQIRDIRRVDVSTRAPRRRSELAEGIDVKFRVGQVFKHKRYDYHGLILGWTVDGAGGITNWEQGAPLRDQWGGYSEPFYRCMIGTDGSDHHIIAEGSIEAVQLRGGVDVLPTMIRDLIPMAGKFFKRWDGEKGIFVSNLTELFPED
ncbi:Uu.00g135880.m01.CDS01 [Anthostomella pinea]|uniref:Uu.00g135880.m01.CDS01 n=1 Tax=Anthostomella pinea TaxID=933095 RepID=A0AAI8VQ56_9PEZI|nr:Uu.00g135880.m01.CDS01 [Anthostomella pinea]